MLWVVLEHRCWIAIVLRRMRTVGEAATVHRFTCSQVAVVRVVAVNFLLDCRRPPQVLSAVIATLQGVSIICGSMQAKDVVSPPLVLGLGGRLEVEVGPRRKPLADRPTSVGVGQG